MNGVTTLHSTLCTLHFALYTLHSALGTRRAFLEEMSQAELEHAEAIDKHRLKLVQDPLPSTVDSKVEVIETVPNWKYVDDISFDEALEVAKTAEIQACMYYDAIADNLAGELQEFFRELSRTEQQHARLIDERRSLLGS